MKFNCVARDKRVNYICCNGVLSYDIQIITVMILSTDENTVVFAKQYLHWNIQPTETNAKSMADSLSLFIV